MGDITLNLVQDLINGEQDVTIQNLTGDATDAISTEHHVGAAGAAGEASLIVEQGTFAGVISGMGALTMAGASGNTMTLTSTSVNTYKGRTNVNSGTLVVDGEIGNGGPADTVTIANGATLSGGGTIFADVSGAATSTITATGNLTMGNSGSASGFSTGGTLTVGTHSVTLHDSDFADLGSTTTIAAGTLTAANGVALGSGDALSGEGTVAGKVSGAANSTITATTGNLTMGDSADTAGFATAGELHVGGNTVTLNDNNVATLGSLTTLAGGTLIADNGVSTSSGEQITGNGTIETSDLANDALDLNSATLTPGTDGTPDTLNFTGDLNLANGTLQIDLNGTTAGTGYDQLNVASGNVEINGATLDLTLGFAPGVNDTFIIIDNDDGDTIAATDRFAGFPDGAVFTLPHMGTNYVFQIQYDTEDGTAAGNNVVLTSFGPAETEVSMNAGDLVVTDINGSNTADNLTITADTANNRYIIAANPADQKAITLTAASDPATTGFTGVNGATQVDAYTVYVPFGSTSLTAASDIIVNSLAGTDSVTLSNLDNFNHNVDYRAGDPTVATAGPNNDDRLTIDGSDFAATVTHTATGADSGTFDVDGVAGAEVTYSGIEDGIDMTGSTSDGIVLTLPAGADAAQLSSLGGGDFRLESTGAPETFQAVDFAAPDVAGGTITINGQAGDAVTISNAINLTANNNNLVVNAGTVNLNADVDTGTGTQTYNGAVTVGGTGSTVTATDVFFNNSVDLNGQTLTVDVSGTDSEIVGAVTANGGLTKDGVGTLTISGKMSDDMTDDVFTGIVNDGVVDVIDTTNDFGSAGGSSWTVNPDGKLIAHFDVADGSLGHEDVTINLDGGCLELDDNNASSGIQVVDSFAGASVRDEANGIYDNDGGNQSRLREDVADDSSAVQVDGFTGEWHSGWNLDGGKSGFTSNARVRSGDLVYMATGWTQATDDGKVNYYRNSSNLNLGRAMAIGDDDSTTEYWFAGLHQLANANGENRFGEFVLNFGPDESNPSKRFAVGFEKNTNQGSNSGTTGHRLYAETVNGAAVTRQTAADSSYSVGAVHLIVAKLTVDRAGNDVVNVWLDPGNVSNEGALGAADLTVNANFIESGDTLSQFRYQSYSRDDSGGSQGTFFDEIRVGGSHADVFGLVAPASEATVNYDVNVNESSKIAILTGLPGADLGDLTGAGDKTLTVDASVGGQTLIFDNTTLTGAAGETFTVDTEMMPEVTLNNLTGPSNLTVDGDGTVFLPTDNSTYTGATTVTDEATLDISHNNSLGSADGTAATGTTVTDGASLRISAPITVGNEALNLAGEGSPKSDGALHSIGGGGNREWNGPITLTDDATIRHEGGNNLRLDGGIDTTAAGHNVTFEAVSTTEVRNTKITGAGDVVKTENGTLNLRVNSDYTGNTLIQDGRVDINQNNALGTTAGTTTVSSGATLRFRGNISVPENIDVTGTGHNGEGGLRTDANTTTLTGTVTLSGTTARVRVDSGTTMHMNGQVTGGAELQKTDNGLLTLNNNANDYTGLTDIIDGTVRVTVNNGLGTAAGGTNVRSGATLEFDATAGPITTPNESFTIAGTGHGGNGAIHTTGGDDVALGTGTITVAADSTILTDAGSTLSSGGNVNLGINTLTLDGQGDVELTGNITDFFNTNATADGFWNSDGIIAGEAEEFTARGGASVDQWVLVDETAPPLGSNDSGGGTPEGASGGFYMQALPDGGSPSGFAGGGTTLAGRFAQVSHANNPTLDYEIYVTDPGTYRLWLRRGGDGGGGDSMYGRLLKGHDSAGDALAEFGDGAFGGAPDWYRWAGEGNLDFDSGTVWEEDVEIESTDGGGTNADANFTITQADIDANGGKFTIRYTYREDGVALDAWALQQIGVAANPSGIVASTELTGAALAGLLATDAIVKTGTGTATLSGNNTYARETLVSQGTLVAGSDNALGTSGGPNGTQGTVVNDNATLAFEGNITSPENLTVGTGTGASLVNNSGVNALTGTVALDGATTVTTTAGTLSLNGVVSDISAGSNSTVAKGGAGTLEFNNANTYTGATTATAGTVGGSGSLAGTLTVTGTTVQPGLNASSGDITDDLGSKNFSMDSGSTLAIDLRGTTGGDNHDQVDVMGTVTVDSNTADTTAGAKLDLDITGFTPTVDDVYVIVDNDGTDAVTGILRYDDPFLGTIDLVDGSAFDKDGQTFTIQYDIETAEADPTGNNIVLIAEGPPETEVSVDGVNLVITDINNDSSDNLTIVDATRASDGALGVLITDTALVLTTTPTGGRVVAAGATRPSAHSIFVPYSAFTGIIFNTANETNMTDTGDDSVTVGAAGLNLDAADKGALTVNAEDIVVSGAVLTDGADAVTLNGSETITLNAAGDITTLGGTVTLNSSSAGGTVTMADGAKVDAAAGTIDVDANGNVTLGGLETTGTVTVDSATGNVIDGGDMDKEIVAANAVINAGGSVGAGNALETQIANLEGSSVGDFSIDNMGALNIGGADAGASGLDVDGNLNITNNAAITQSEGVTVDGTTTIDATGNNVTLDDATNDFGGAVNVTANNVSLDDVDDINLGNVSATGNLDVDTAGNVEITGTVDVDGAADIDTNVNGGAGGTITDTGVGVVDIEGTTTLDAGNQDVVLDNANNDFENTVNATGNNVTLDDADNVELGNVSATGNLDVDTAGNVDITGTVDVNGNADIDTNANGGAGGTITDTGGVVAIDGTATLDAGNQNITLDNVANDFGGVVNVTNANDASLDDANGINLGDINTANDLNVDAGGNVVVSGAVNVDGNLDIETDANNAAGGSITDTTGSLDIEGTSDLDAGAANDILLDSPTNDFTGAVSVNTANNVELVDQNAIDLGASTIQGNLDVLAGGAITDSGVLDVEGDACFETTGANADITLDQLDVTGQIGLNTAGAGSDATIVNVGPVMLKDTAVTGNLDVTAGGDITDTGTVEVGGTTDLDANGNDVILDTTANDFTGPVNVTNATNVTLDDQNAINLGNIAATGNLDVDSGGNVTVTGTVNVDGSANIDANANGGTGGTIADTGAGVLDIEGAITLDAGDQDVALDNANNDFTGVVNVTNAANVTLDDQNELILGNVNTAGNLDVDTAGNVEVVGTVAVGGNANIDTNANGGPGGTITDTGAGRVDVEGSTTLDANGNDITLDSPANDFTGAVSIVSGANVTLVDQNAIDFGNSNVSGNLNVDAGGAITDSGTLDVNGSTTLDANGNPITLDTATNDFTGPVSIVSGGNVTLVDQNAIDLGDSNVNGNLNVDATRITDSGDVDVNGSTTLDANGGNITLDSSGNDFTGPVSILSANNVDLVDKNALNLGASNIAGNLDVLAGGNVTDSGTISVSGNACVETTTNIALDQLDVAGFIGLTAGGNATAVNTGTVRFKDTTTGGNLNVIATTGDIVIGPGSDINAGGAVSLTAEDDFTLATGGSITAASVDVRIDAGNVGEAPGTGGTANVLGSISTSTTPFAATAPLGQAGTRITGGAEADTFNITPSRTTSFMIAGAAPTTLPGDVLNIVGANGNLNPAGVPGSGVWEFNAFSGLQGVAFSSIEGDNVQPVLTGGVSTVHPEGAGPIAIFPNLVIEQANLITGAIIRFTGGYVPSEDLIYATVLPRGISVEWDPTTGSLIFTTTDGGVTAAAMQEALRSVVYDNIRRIDPTAGPRSFFVVVFDGTIRSNFIFSTIEQQRDLDPGEAPPSRFGEDGALGEGFGSDGSENGGGTEGEGDGVLGIDSPRLAGIFNAFRHLGAYSPFGGGSQFFGGFRVDRLGLGEPGLGFDDFDRYDIGGLPPNSTLTPFFAGTADAYSTIVVTLHDEISGFTRTETVMVDGSGHWTAAFAGAELESNRSYTVTIQEYPVTHQFEGAVLPPAAVGFFNGSVIADGLTDNVNFDDVFGQIIDTSDVDVALKKLDGGGE